MPKNISNCFREKFTYRQPDAKGKFGYHFWILKGDVAIQIKNLDKM